MIEKLKGKNMNMLRMFGNKKNMKDCQGLCLKSVVLLLADMFEMIA